MQKNTWIPLADHPELRVGQYVVPNFISNSVALAVDEHTHVLVSPGKQLLESWPAAKRGDDIDLHIIMPNGFHYMGVPAWQQAFPNAKLYASANAIPRLREKGIKENGHPDGIRALQSEQPPLPTHYDILFPVGHRAGDIWLRKQTDTSTSWITCDSFLNYERYSNQPIARFLQKKLDAAPGLKLSQVIKFYILNDRKSFKHWALNQLAQDQPTTLIPSHGEVLQSDTLAQALAELLQKRL